MDKRRQHLKITMHSKAGFLIILWITTIMLSNSVAFPKHISDDDSAGGFRLEYGAPLITPLAPDVTLDVDSDYSIRCESKEPIIWQSSVPPYLSYDKQFATTDPARPYGSILYLNAIDYTFVGSYFCIKKAYVENISENDNNITLWNQLLNDNVASSIYVYVNDPDHLLVNPDNQFILAYQYQDVLIPCKPTMPNVEVLLTTSDGKTFSSENTGRYNPERGFVIQIRSLAESGLYVCRPKTPSLNEEDEEIEFNIHFVGNDNIDLHSNYINKPTVSSENNGHVYEGESFNLTCEVSVKPDTLVDTKWQTPITDESRKTMIGPYFDPTNQSIVRGVLNVVNAQKSDSGYYKCTVSDHSHNEASSKYTITVLSRSESYINISEANNYYTIIGPANKTVQMNVHYRGHPMPTLRWYHPDGSLITPSNKYTITTTNTAITLKITGIQMLDSGTYELRASNDIITKELHFNVSISDKPIANVENVYLLAGKEAVVTCKVFSYPKAGVAWGFEPCSIVPRWPACQKNIQQNFNSSREISGELSIESYHEVRFTPTTPGIIHCLASNGVGKTIAKGHILIGDINENITISSLATTEKIARGDELIMTCIVLAYYFTDKINWYKDGLRIKPNENIKILNSTSNYSYKKTLILKSLEDEDSGSYECRAERVENREGDKVESSYLELIVHEPLAPTLKSTNFDPNSEIKSKLGDALELECIAEAIPRAEITWFKDDHKIENNESSSILYLKYIKPEDEGKYRCVAENRLGKAESYAEVVITNMPGVKRSWIMIMSAIAIILISLVLILIWHARRQRKLLREYRAAGLANFEEGAIEQINPALTLDEQAELLPYDPNFEFPRDKLKLGKQLGAGAFGVVLKAHAEGIIPEEKESVVAVKMIKRTADNEVVRALVSELKIMVHLGGHLNVVNLLGAVTKNIGKRELMVIVEYCHFGNVQNVLLKNRKRFINQIHPDTDKIDPTIVEQRFSHNFEINRDGLKYVNLNFSNHHYINNIKNINNTLNNHSNSDNDPRSGTRAGRPNSISYLRQSELYEGHVDSCATEQTTIPEDEILSNNSVQPAWRSNYKNDSTEALTLTTSDLISWAYQVSRGMEYLSSRKVLHGDLAARNILLCKGNIVKICDFGLARSMYKSDNYKKQGDARLPIKWLALESLSDHVFSTYTDIWSFGIVMWEFFSLAKVPYPGMDPNQSLYMKLKDGYRMEKPPYANQDLYDIMLECWSTNPECRPLFNVLAERFGRMLGEEVTNHYLDLNAPYLQSNKEYQRRTETDYLALMGSPDEMAPAAPRYVNGHILPEIRIDPSNDDYLQMNPDHSRVIFSPTYPKETDITNDNESNAATTTSFTYPTTTKLANVQPEEIPMLSNNAYDDASPEDKRKFNNIKQQKRTAPIPSPRRHIAETKLHNNVNSIDDDDDDDDDVDGDSESYINVKSNKTVNPNNNGTRIDAFSNPGYHIIRPT